MAGAGIAPLETRHNWRIPGHAAVVLEPMPAAGATIRRAARARRPRKRRRAGRRSGAWGSPSARSAKIAHQRRRVGARGGGRPRVAGDQWPRRLRRGDGGGRADATLSRTARRRAAHAARAHRHAEPSLRAAPAVGRHALRDRRPGARGQRARVAGRPAPRRVPARLRPAGLAVRAGRHRRRKARAHAPSAEHRARHVSPHPRRPRPDQAASGASRPAARGIRPRGDRRALHDHRRRGSPRAVHRRAAIRRCASRSTAGAPRSRSTAASSTMSTTAPRPSAAMPTSASCGAPGTGAWT